MNSRSIPEIYVLWHPRFANGEALAQRIHRWLRPDGRGPQVYYRCLPAPGAPPGGLPPPLPNENRRGAAGDMCAFPASSLGKRQLVVLLIDAQMVVDHSWRHWINRLGESADTSQRAMLPVALDSSAFNVPPALQSLNFLRPAGVPADAAGSVWAADVLEGVARSLQKQLTEALCERLLNTGLPGEPGSENAGAKVKIFLSHAKADGSEPARRIRDYLYSQTQIAAFFDENDIPFGSLFERVLDNNVAGEQLAAAMIAVRSARYASRPWCRREVSLFRRPRLDFQSASGSQLWTLNPTLVVDTLAGGGISAGIAELGNSPTIRWAENLPQQEETIVTTLLRDVLLAAHQRAVGRALLGPKKRIVLNWIPDPASLLHVTPIRTAAAKLRVFYPGRDLSGPERQTLRDFFPQARFISFDRIWS